MLKKLYISLICVTANVVLAQDIKLNQLGFYPSGEKIAIVPGVLSGLFEITSEDGTTIFYTDTIEDGGTWSHSAEEVGVLDFTAFTTPGTYIAKAGGLVSYPFDISDNVHQGVAVASLKAYYYNRCSAKLDAQYAGLYAREGGHWDTLVIIHSSAASPTWPTNTFMQSPKGWYDAGDYNKYIVNSGISTYTLLAAYEYFSEYYDQLNLNIPESDNQVPDILDEAKWNIDWMLTMQDPGDGGVSHKLTHMSFQGIQMPEDVTATRWIVMKTTAATLDFCAVMAAAARVYANYEPEFPGYSDRCLQAALDAWDWAQQNNNVAYNQPIGFGTGQYGDSQFADEFDWAAAELFVTTKDDAYAAATGLANASVGTPSWGYVAPLAWVSLARHINDLPASMPSSTVQAKVTSTANSLMNTAKNSAYRVAMGNANNNFVWGSNGHAGNQGLMLLAAYRITGNEDYLSAALSNLDYLLGRNATGYCFVTGMGDKSPMHIHHRPSEADGITAPVPGFIAGGPHSGQQDGCTGYPSDLRALSYLDEECSYSTNEITINWNAPLAFLSGAAEFYRSDFSNAAPSILIEPSDVSVQEGETATFSVTATGPGSLTYQWYADGVAISGATDNSLIISDVQLGDTKTYKVDVTNENGTTTSREVQLSILIQEPFSGDAQSIPGRIEAESFDLGGQGLAYNEIGSSNQGGDFRVSESVDIEITGDDDGEYNVGWTESGEWLEYEVEVSTSGFYDVDLRVASNTAGGTVSIYMDWDKVVDDYSFTFTGGWQDYVTSTVNDVFIMEGNHIMKFFIEADGFNINYFEFELAQESDCNGDVGGNALLDVCGRCTGGNSGESAIDEVGDCPVGLAENKNKVSVEVFPNPFTGSFSLEGNEEVNYVECYSSLGELIFEGIHTEDIGHLLPRGAYILKIHTDQGVATRKALKR